MFFFNVVTLIADCFVVRFWSIVACNFRSFEAQTKTINYVIIWIRFRMRSYEKFVCVLPNLFLLKSEQNWNWLFLNFLSCFSLLNLLVRLIIVFLSYFSVFCSNLLKRWIWKLYRLFPVFNGRGIRGQEHFLWLKKSP